MDPTKQTGSMYQLIQRVGDYSEAYMAQFDASHDYQHVQRVLRLAKRIESDERRIGPQKEIDGDVVTIACLMHDVGDKKYEDLGLDSSATPVADALIGFGASVAAADKVQIIVSHVSYSKEIRDPGQVRLVISKHPELAIVQDADRLDAMGAVGIARAFTYSAAKSRQATLDDPISHMHAKLLKLKPMMKTASGHRMACEREARLKQFSDWWTEETNGVDGQRS